MRRWKKKLIEELEMDLVELIATSGWCKHDIHTDFKAYTALKKRSDTPGSFLNNHNIGQAKELENSLVPLCRNSIIHIIHKQNKTQATGKTATATSTATNATSNISNTSLTSTATLFDSMTFSLNNANKITGCS